MKCADGCGLDVPELSGYKPEKVLYTCSDGISTLTCDGEQHFLNATRDRRRALGVCNCEVQP